MLNQALKVSSGTAIGQPSLLRMRMLSKSVTFLDLRLSRGSVATYCRWGENTYRIFLQINWWKNFRNRSTFAKVIIEHTHAIALRCICADYIIHCRHSPIYLSPHTGGPKAGRGSRPSLKNCYFWLVWTTTTTNKLVLRPFLHDDPRVTDLWAGARTISHSGSWCGLQELLFNLPPHPVPILSSSPVADMQADEILQQRHSERDPQDFTMDDFPVVTLPINRGLIGTGWLYLPRRLGFWLVWINRKLAYLSSYSCRLNQRSATLFVDDVVAVLSGCMRRTCAYFDVHG